MEFDYSFEQAVARLEEIGGLLSSGSATIEQSIDLYKEAGALIQYSEQKLKNAQLAVEKIAAGFEEAET